MAKIANAGYYPAGTISIAADEFTLAIDSAMLNPNTPTTVINDIGGGVQVVAGVPVWALVLSVVQDLVTVGSLSKYLVANQGLVKDAVYKPQAGGSSITLKVLIVSAPIGGAGGAVAKSSVTLPVIGQPAFA